MPVGRTSSGRRGERSPGGRAARLRPVGRIRHMSNVATLPRIGACPSLDGVRDVVRGSCVTVHFGRADVDGEPAVVTSVRSNGRSWSAFLVGAHFGMTVAADQIGEDADMPVWFEQCEPSAAHRGIAERAEFWAVLR